jgi:hypothetical protein
MSAFERLALVPQFYAMIHANMGDAIPRVEHPVAPNGRVVPGRRFCASMLYMILLPALRRVARRKISVPEAA